MSRRRKRRKLTRDPQASAQTGQTAITLLHERRVSAFREHGCAGRELAGRGAPAPRSSLSRVLEDAHLVGFVATSDLGVAEAFYGDLLGLQRVASTPLAKVYDVSGAQLCVVRADHVEPSGQTVFAWSVADLGATVARMRDAGIELITYTGLDQDADRAWTSPGGARVVWFHDPEGHILSVMQMPS